MIKRILLFIVLYSVLFSAGCSSKGESPGEGKGSDPSVESILSNDPVTVKLAAGGGVFSEEEFKRYVIDPVKKKYPQITVERINTSSSKLSGLIAAGTIPDILTNYPGPMSSNLKTYGLLYNMEPLIDKFNFNINRFSSEAIQTVRIAGGQDYLAGLPVYTNAFALFYNKDIFDKFAMDYPQDGLYWDEVAELGRQLTRMDDGILYRGIFPEGIGRIQQQLSIPFADFTTDESLLLNESWQEAFQIWGSLFKIPQLTEGDFLVPNAGNNQEAFLNGKLAMIASHSNLLTTLRSEARINWDMVIYPQHRKAPGIGQRLDSPIMSVTEPSKVKDAAFAVIETILSDEVQIDMMRNGRMSVLKDEQIKHEFGKGMEDLAGKNVTAMTKLKFAVMTPFEYLPDGDVDKVLRDAFNAYIIEEKDLNTALREADEQMNLLIQEKMINK